MELALFLIVALLAGACVGVLSGLLGIGGGVIMVPLFRLVFAFEPVMATATSLFCIFPTALSGAITHVRDRTCVPAFGIAMGIGGAIMSPVGVWLATRSPAVAIMAVTAVIMVYSSTTMVRRALAIKPSGSEAGKGPEGTADALEGEEASASSEFTARRACIAAAVGALAGFGSGYVGVGGGFIMVPLMLSLLHMPMSKASGTSLIAVAILAVPGIIEQLILGNVAIMFGIAVICGSIPGAILGARLVKRVPERGLRLMFAVVLIVGACILLGNEIAALV